MPPRRDLPPIPERGPPCWRCNAPTLPSHKGIATAAAVYACHECRATLWKAYRVGGYRPLTWKEYQEEIGHPGGPPLKKARRAPQKVAFSPVPKKP